jgi:tetratricopeptide (TPR) repeat protein
MAASTGPDLQQAYRLLKAGRISEASSICQALMKANRKNPLLYAILGELAETKGQLEEAVGNYQKSIKLDPKQFMTHIALGQALTYQGRFQEAITSYKRAMRLNPKSPHALAAMADAHDKQGNPEKALELIDPLLERGEESDRMAVVYSTVQMNRGEYDRAVEVASRHLDRSETNPNARQLLGFTLGRSLEKLKRYDESFLAYKNANEVIASRFDSKSYLRQIETLIEMFSETQLSKLPRSNNQSDLPVFIAGMPRSGTTLVERIIDAHPMGSGAGEIVTTQNLITDLPLRILSSLPYPQCINDLDQSNLDELAKVYLDELIPHGPKALRLVDKNLTNWMHLGFLALLFPKARIIHCTRDAMDTGFSCFTSSLMSQALTWASDLEAIGMVHRQHERLMRHWRNTLELPILEVCYEAMVDDQENQSRRLIDFLGLDWDERCLRFHETHESSRSKGIAPTLSYDQVRRPVYRSSCGRFKPFEKHLGPMRLALDSESN